MERARIFFPSSACEDDSPIFKELKAALRSTSGTSNPCSQIGLVSSTNAEALSILDMTPFISSCKPLIVKETPVRDSNFFKKELPGPDNAVAASELGKSILK